MVATPYQWQTLEQFKRMGYREPDTVERIPLGHGRLMVRMRGKWQRELALVVNPDGSYHAAVSVIEEDAA